MTEVIIPDVLNEQFTIRPGNHPKRLREMTGEEVVEAMEFYYDESERLGEEVRRYDDVIQATLASGGVLTDEQIKQAEEAMLRMKAHYDAAGKFHRISGVVFANLPPAADTMPLSECVPRFWPTRGAA